MWAPSSASAKESSALLLASEGGAPPGGGTFTLRTPAGGAATLCIERDALLTALTFRVRRFRQCRSLPLSVTAYAFFLVALLLHAKIPVAFDVEAGAVASLVDASGFADGVADAATWFDWAGGALVPLLLPADAPAADAAAWPVRYLNGYAVAAGGLRFAQARSAAQPCAEDAALAALNGIPCYPSNALSRAPFGEPDAAVAGAFAAGASRGPEGAARIAFPFEFVVNVANTSAADGAARVEALRTGGWIDAATRAVTTTLSLYNGQTASWVVLRWTVDFQRGGRTALATHVVSFPADPYAAPPDDLATATDGTGGSDGSAVPGGFLVFVDLIVVAYGAYLLVGTGRRVWAIACARGVPCGTRAHDAVLNYWLALDYGSVIALATLGGCWASFVAAAADVRARVAAEATRTPAVFGGAAHAGTAAAAAAAGDKWEAFKSAGVAALIVLSLRLFKYFQFQPRLSVMTESIAMALADGAHFTLLFGVMLGARGGAGGRGGRGAGE
jgi:hypothetical protein